MSSDKNNEQRLRELSGSDYEIADGQSDIRGWDVKDTTGIKLGEVSELIFEPATRKVRYMVVDLGNNDLDLEEREVLIPIGVAQLHEEDDDVLLPNVSIAQLQSLPVYNGDNIIPSAEYATRGAFAENHTKLLI